MTSRFTTLKFLLAGVFALGSMQLFGQVLQYTPSQSVTAVTSEENAEVFINVKNVTGQATSYSWKTLQNTFTDSKGWSSSLCDPFQCFTYMPDSASLTLDNNAVGAFSVSVARNSKPGLGTLKLVVYKTNDPSHKDTLTLTLDATHAGIQAQKQAEASVNVYPNPAQNTLTISNTGNNFIPARYAVVNTLGQEVMGDKLTAGTAAQLDLSALSSGIYYLQLTDNNGQQVVKIFDKN
jgi:hypothetical protein